MLTIKQFTFNPIQENTYVIFNDKGSCIILDPGCYYEEEREELTDFKYALPFGSHFWK